MAHLAVAGGSPVRIHPAPSWPLHTEEEEQRVAEVVRSGKWWFGENVKTFETEFAAFHTARFGITCPNGTIGLMLAMKALGIDVGDEVIVPAYSLFRHRLGSGSDQRGAVFCRCGGRNREH